MNVASPVTASAIAPLATDDPRGLLRFIACGSVDDGKSTLMGQLLWASGVVPDDQRLRLEGDAQRLGRDRTEVDYSHLLDGLASEREQGITIDVAYRFFSTARRAFIMADAPGHEQYTCNMLTGASTADLAVLLVDARHGLKTQTYRHSYLSWFVGIRHLVLAVNKMDIVGYDRERFQVIAEQYRAFVTKLGIENVQSIPVCATQGDNVASTSAKMRWYGGPSLLSYLEGAETRLRRSGTPATFYMPVQWINRPDHEFRGLAGTVAAGMARPGQPVRVLPAGRDTKIARIVTLDGDLDQAIEGQSVTVTLADDVDVTRGDVLASPTAGLGLTRHVKARLAWFGPHALKPDDHFLLKLGHKIAVATVSAVSKKTLLETLESAPAGSLQFNDIGAVELALDRQIVCHGSEESPTLRGFILIDRTSNDTVAAGFVESFGEPERNIHPPRFDIGVRERRALNGHGSGVIWMTGLSGAGKSTLGNELVKRLYARGVRTALLDGDNLRNGLNKDLGFSLADRAENIRRTGELAKLMADAGLVVVVALISPFRAQRDAIRDTFAPGEFIEVHVDVPLAVAEQRDPKGLYRKARLGLLPDFTGIDSGYERPEKPEVVIDATSISPQEAADYLCERLQSSGLL